MATLPTFSGKKEDYEDFRINLVFAAKVASPELNGLLGNMLSTEQYTAKFGAEYEPIPDPGPEPEVTSSPTHNAWQVWKFKKQRKNEFMEALNKFTAELHASLDETTRRMMRTEDGEALDLQQTFAKLDKHWGIMGVGDLTAALTSLLIPFDGIEDIQLYFGRHEKVHRLAHRAGQAMNDSDKIRFLVGGVESCQLFTLQLGVWRTQFPDIASQKYSGLRTCLESAWANRAPVPANTASSLGYAGSLVPFPGAYSVVPTRAITQPVNTTGGAFHGITPDMWYALAAAYHGHQTRPTKRAEPDKQRRSPRYCWTHGLCAHTGTECRTPGPGHVPTATLSDTQGGSTKGLRTDN
jgi:hypothetical protein